ncbi:hypothetical protein CERSUDRAFT_114162 [Gelatoporia subvermispora B]|uniref:Uncharacterized protein n=1 Tax=Ceriporiopsis subvermispora (strain B) TaxID=914234 RepID=M2QKJ2_CERS8|nr:hypothetical protein CERSUDRAFT_114162 [Gelatoporia subvermispora B]
MSRPRKHSEAAKSPGSINLFNWTEKDSHLLSRKNSDSFRTCGTRVRAGSISKAGIVLVEAGRVKDGCTQCVESQACEKELSAVKKPSSFERAARPRPDTPVMLFRSSSQTCLLNVSAHKRSISTDNILRAPAPSLFSRSKRNRAPAAALAASEAPRGCGSTRTVAQISAQPPPPPLHRSAPTDPLVPRLRVQVLRVSENPTRTEPEPLAAPKVSQCWYRPAKPVSPPQAPADRNRVLRCDERRSLPPNAKRERPQVHPHGNSAHLQQYATRRGSHDSAQRAAERPGSRTSEVCPHMGRDEERMMGQERLERIKTRVRSNEPSRESSRQHDTLQVQAGRHADVAQPEQSVLGQSTQRRRRQESVGGASPGAKCQPERSCKSDQTHGRIDGHIRPQARGGRDIGQRAY